MSQESLQQNAQQPADALVAQYRRIGIAAVVAASPWVQMSQSAPATRQQGVSGEKLQQQG
jgi:hypothetical protein